MTMLAEVGLESANGVALVPEVELQRTEAVKQTMDRFFSGEAVLRTELDKEIHPVVISPDKRAEIVKYCSGDAIVHSLEIPLDDQPLQPGLHDAMALSIKTFPDGSQQAEKHRFSWQILPNGKHIPAPREPSRPFDSGDYKLMQLFTERMQPLRLSRALF